MYLFRIWQELGEVLEEVVRAVLLVARKDLHSNLLRVVDLVSLHEDFCKTQGGDLSVERLKMMEGASTHRQAS